MHWRSRSSGGAVPTLSRVFPGVYHPVQEDSMLPASELMAEAVSRACISIALSIS